MVVERLMFKPTEAAQALGIGNTKMYELLASGVIPSVRVGKTVRVPVELLRQWIEKQSQKPEAA